MHDEMFMTKPFNPIYYAQHFSSFITELKFTVV